MESISDPPTNPQKVEAEDISTQPEEHTNTEQRDIFPIEAKGRPVIASKVDAIDSPIMELLRDILEAVQDSSIAGPTASKDNRSRFWGKYKRVAEEHDSEFLERYSSDMDIVLIFAGLFSAVSTSFIVAMEPSLLPDPSDTTNSLLFQIAQILGNATTPSQVVVPTMPIFAGPSRTDVWVQTIAYLSLASSLLAAFGAVLGKQWLGYYKSSRYGRGTLEQRGIRRQEKFNGLQTWYFDAILQSFPLLIQCSLLLFGLALSGHMWSEQRTIAGVIIATTAFGILFYLFTLFASLLSPACPFQSPLSTLFRLIYRYISSNEWLTYVSWRLHIQLQISRNFLIENLSTTKAIMHHFVHKLSHPRSTAKDIESGSSQSNNAIKSPSLDVAPKPETLCLPEIPLKSGAAHSALWLLETSTDPEVLLAAARMVPEVEWHPDLDVSAGLDQLWETFRRFVDQDKSLIPDNASTYCHAQFHFYSEMDEEIRARYIGHDIGNLIDASMYDLGREDHLLHMIKIVVSSEQEHDNGVPTYLAAATQRDILQVLHLLPYATFRFTSVEGYLESSLRSLVLSAISRILEGQNSLSPKSPGVSDCAMVIGMLLGCQFSLMDKRKLDKSQAFSDLLEAIHQKLAALVYRRQRDTPKSVCDEFNDNTATPNERSTKLEEHMAIDCLPFILPLSALISFDLSQFLGIDGFLCICKLYFDKSVIDISRSLDTSKCIGSTVTCLPYLQASMRGATRILKSRYSTYYSFLNGELGSIDIGWTSPVWNLEEHGRRNDASSHHPVILGYMEYLCTTFPDNMADLQGALLVSIYGLADLQKSPVEIRSYLDTITFCMGADKPDELRRAALRAICAKREIFLSPVDHSTLGWDAVLAAFSDTLYNLICPTPNQGKDHFGQDTNNGTSISDTGDLDECIFPYLKLISTLAQVDIWHARLFQDGHLKASISLVTPQLIESYPLLACLRASIALRVLKSHNNHTAAHTLLGLEEDVWQEYVTEFSLALTSIQFLVDIHMHQQLANFSKLLPEFLTSLEQATSVGVVPSILKNIPDAGMRIKQILEKKGQYSGFVSATLDIFRRGLEQDQQDHRS